MNWVFVACFDHDTEKSTDKRKLVREKYGKGTEN